MATGRIIEPDLEFIRDIKKNGGSDIKKCYQCATCSTVCGLSPDGKPFPRKEMILAGWGQSEELIKDPDIWLCFQCNDCSTYCPRGARPGDVLAAVRSHIYKSISFPSFMGKALANPKMLPYLFIVPIIIIGLLILNVTGGDFSFVEDDIVFGNFIPHGWIEGLFMTGNAIIFLFAFIGLWRFWKGLKQGGSGNGPGFISSLIKTATNIILHKDFFECDTNKPRSWAHILVLFGFVGSMATAGLAVMSMVLFHLDPPIPMTHPIKWLGNIAGFAGFIGMLIIIFRRLKGRDEVGANGYADWLFIIMLFSVFTTGLMTQFSRLADVAVLAYSIYYIHLVFVFFLLWYMPYSKFAHMIYRTMALVHAKQDGRK